MTISLLARLWVVLGLLSIGSAMAQRAPKFDPPAKLKATAAPNQSDYKNFAMKMRVYKPASVTCYGSRTDAFTTVPPPEAYLQRRNARVAAAPTAQFIVEYKGFSPEAQKAFQYAVDIWSSLISSPVPIRIKAYWQDLGAGSSSGTTIGQARPDDYRIGFDGAQKAFGVYPIALAEKIARRQLNSPDSADIYAAFNSNSSVKFYYGTDAKPGAGQIDLATVVLHELGHGLGFVSGMSLSQGVGFHGYGYPTVFAHFIQNAQAKSLVDFSTYPDQSQALAQQLTGGSLYFSGDMVTKRTGGKARLYAPSTYNAGSSISHLDESTYPQGTANSLMTPTIANAEAIHSPGPMTLAMFEDMEWKTTSLLHTAFDDMEDVKDLTFTARVVSDTIYDASSVKLYIYKGTTPPTSLSSFQTVTPTRVGTTDQYTYTIPANQAAGQYRYYYEVKDASGRTFTNPGKNYTGGQVVNYFVMGPDNVAPAVRRHIPQPYELRGASDSLFLSVAINDDRQMNMDTAYVEYAVNSQATKTSGLRYAGSLASGDSVYVGLIVPGTATNKFLNAGDVLKYRIIARDKSKNKNQTILPATGFYEVKIIAPQTTALNSFSTSFASVNATDFVGNSFSITQPSGFTDPGIHSAHPYERGADVFYQRNTYLNYLTPIKLKANPDSATLRFDEVVLVEPGDAGAKFGDDGFYDYVIAEGSKDGGITWLPLADGYDSNDQSAWATAYNRSLVDGLAGTGEKNSSTVGTPSLYKTREIYMLDNGNFKANDVILIRFRLFSDQLAIGWGWGIDNLRIQTPPAAKILATEPQITSTFQVFPNPSSNGQIRVQAKLAKATTEADLTVTTASGQTLRQLPLKVQGTSINEQLDLTQLPTGFYFLQLKAGDSVQTKKIMIAR